jgi:hypothetical protein
MERGNEGASQQVLKRSLNLNSSTPVKYRTAGISGPEALDLITLFELLLGHCIIARF